MQQQLSVLQDQLAEANKALAIKDDEIRLVNQEMAKQQAEIEEQRALNVELILEVDQLRASLKSKESILSRASQETDLKIFKL